LKLKDIHKQTIDKYGYTVNVNKAIQELQELCEELRDNKNGAANHGNIMEEIADVRNMLDKLIIMYNYDSVEIAEIQVNKMRRTHERLNAC